jgi:cytochrome c oxidase subunit IV
MIDKVLDERLIAHRYKATRLAALVGAIAMSAYLIYGLVAKGMIRWDLFLIMCIMAATKLAATFYYRKTN